MTGNESPILNALNVNNSAERATKTSVPPPISLENSWLAQLAANPLFTAVSHCFRSAKKVPVI